MEKQNRLAFASSPYLKQHADNPVDWYEWGDEALQKAKSENKPLIISIGYAACHWCHVMAHESFSDNEIATYMNEHFVCIKVDREERPDIDQIYMDAAHIVSGRGGWPLNAVALPDGRPFFAATYFPPHQWLDVLQQLSDVYTKDIPRALKAAESITQGINTLPFSLTTAKREFSQDDYHQAFQLHISKIDFELGGYKRAPKFMMPVGLEFLLQYYYFTQNKDALKAVTKTLDAMARGGLNDQIGGGFARYSTDDRWLVPHFEKMLYDNAQLISLYAKAFQCTNNPFYLETAEKTVDFAETELLDGSGGFYASIDADSEHEEGKFYVWTKEEIEKICGDKAGLIIEFYNITDAGNWEHGKNILHYTESKQTFAANHDIEYKDFEKLLNHANQQLLKYRATRVRPGTDDKILCAWNALMLSAYTDIFKASGKSRYLDGALRTAHFIVDNLMNSDGSLFRVYKDGKVSVTAFLDDYAFTASAFIDLYQVTFDKIWVDKALILVEHVLLHFADKHTEGLFYYTSDISGKLVARKAEYSDNVIPASASAMAHVFDRLSILCDRPDLSMHARTMLFKVLNETVEYGSYYANWGQLLGKFVYPRKEIVITGADALIKLSAIQQIHLPDAIFAGGEVENLPLLKNRVINNKTLIYVCKDSVCGLPAENIPDAIGLLIK
jgi:uncharacterized protein YyaL (SSP411 family)